MTEPTKDLISRLRELEAKATPGPWEATEPADGDVFAWVSAKYGKPLFGTSGRAKISDTELVAALRNAAPQLLAMAEAGEKMAAAADYAAEFLATFNDSSTTEARIAIRLDEAMDAWKKATGGEMKFIADNSDYYAKLKEVYPPPHPAIQIAKEATALTEQSYKPIIESADKMAEALKQTRRFMCEVDTRDFRSDDHQALQQAKTDSDAALAEYQKAVKE